MDQVHRKQFDTISSTMSFPVPYFSPSSLIPPPLFSLSLPSHVPSPFSLFSSSSLFFVFYFSLSFSFSRLLVLFPTFLSCFVPPHSSLTSYTYSPLPFLSCQLSVLSLHLPPSLFLSWGWVNMACCRFAVARRCLTTPRHYAFAHNFRQILTNFQNSFTVRLTSKFAIHRMTVT